MCLDFEHPVLLGPQGVHLVLQALQLLVPCALHQRFELLSLVRHRHRCRVLQLARPLAPALHRDRPLGRGEVGLRLIIVFNARLTLVVIHIGVAATAGGYGLRVQIVQGVLVLSGLHIEGGELLGLPERPEMGLTRLLLEVAVLLS